MELSLRVAGAMISEKEAMAFTIAGEEIIEKHFTKQKETLMMIIKNLNQH